MRFTGGFRWRAEAAYAPLKSGKYSFSVTFSITLKQFHEFFYNKNVIMPGFRGAPNASLHVITCVCSKYIFYNTINCILFKLLLFMPDKFIGGR